MLKHYDFIPFKITEVPSGVALIFAPHPDDETFGMGGTVLQMTATGQIVTVVMMTDGAAGGDAEIRKEEFLKAREALSIKEVHFFGAPDGDLLVNTANTKKVIDLLDAYTPENVFFPSPLEYHPDHRATAWLVWNALQSIDFAGNIFSYEIANQSPVNKLVDITSVMAKKTEVMKLYASQNTQLDYVETISAINRSRAYTASSKNIKYVEAFFAFPDISMDLMSYYYQRLNSYHKGMKVEKLPLVSVLIRTKDRLERLRSALESLTKQTYRQFEVNIVNDGGVSVQSVVDAFDFERFFVKNHENSKGRAAAANALLRMVQGEYAMFLDDDDTFDADHIENLVKVMRQNENMLAAYSGIRVGEGINKPPFNQLYNAALLRKMNFIPFHAVLFSTKLIEEGCKFDESLEVYEDWDFWLQVAQKTEFYHLNKITATYNINGQSGAGGAGGHSLNEKDLNYWTLKVYEKWQSAWSPRQLSQTFNTLAGLNAGQVQDVKKQMQKLVQKNNEKIKKRDDSIKDLQTRLERQQQHSKHLNNHVDQLIKEKIREHDEGNPLKRDFELVSARNYENQCIALFEEVFKEKMDKEFWNWKYAGVKWRGVCALKEGKVVGHYNGMLRNILYFGQHKKAIPAGDTMVSPKARGGIKQNSPFYAMAHMWIKINLGLKQEFLLSFGFPNRWVMALAVHLGLYKQVDSIIEVHWNTEKEENGDCYSELYSSNEKNDAVVISLWQGMAGDFKDALLGIRNVPYLKHRYFNHPKFNYSLYIVEDREKKPVGLFVLKQEGETMMLMDVVGKKEHFSQLIAEAQKRAKERECNTLKCWITTSKAKLFNHHNAQSKEVDVAIPTSNITDNFDPDEIKDKWFLMYGDTDFI